MHSIVALSTKVHAVNEDATLIAAARADPAAFGALYHCYRDRIYAYLRARSSCDEDAADLTQQVFLQAFDAFPGYRGGGETFAPWLFRIARNAATDGHRRRRSTVTWDAVPEVLQPVAEQDVEGEVVRHDETQRLRTLFATLDVDRRELLVLRFVAGLSVLQIALVIGKSEAATQKRLFRTIQALKEQYHDDAR